MNEPPEETKRKFLDALIALREANIEVAKHYGASPSEAMNYASKINQSILVGGLEGIADIARARTKGGRSLRGKESCSWPKFGE